MANLGKRTAKIREGVDPAKAYSVDEAVKMVKERAKAKFDETIEIAMNLGVDPKHADQMVRGVVTLPNGTGRSVRVAVFAEGDKAREAEEAGADVVGSAELADKIQGGWMDFDIVITSPDMMKHVGKLGKVLGPQGKMPSPKSGTVTPDVGNAVREFKAGKVEFRTDAGGNVHAPVGKVSFSPAQLADNVQAFMDTIVRAKPSAAKGTYIRSATISSTMGPGVRIDAATVDSTSEEEG